MPTKKIADLPKPKICQDKEHIAPTHQYFEPGIYEHTCPTCGKVTRFTVGDNKPTMQEMYDDENPDYITGTEDGI